MSEPAPTPTEVARPPRSRGATRQAWIERLQRFAASGLSPAQFCASEGVSLPSFYSWKRRLAATSAPDPTAADTGLPLLPVRLQPQPTPVELLLPHGLVLRIPPDADPATLRTLLCLLGVLPC